MQNIYLLDNYTCISVQDNYVYTQDNHICLESYQHAE